MDKFWLNTWRECLCLAQRSYWRSGILLLHFRLRNAERKLGELGWQQVDFPADDANIRELRSMEKNQARLLFERSEIKEQISNALAREGEFLIATRRKLRVAEEVANTIEMKCGHLLESLEKETNRKSPSYVLDGLHASLAAEEESLRQVRKTIFSLHRDQVFRQEKSETELNDLQLSFRNLENRKGPWDHRRRAHFRDVGKELADAGIAPLNQPEALHQVLKFRMTQDSLQSCVRESLEASKQSSWLVTGTVRLIAAVVVCINLFAIFQILKPHD